MEHTQGGFLISKIKQIQGRILKTVDSIWNSRIQWSPGRILFVLWEKDFIPIHELSREFMILLIAEASRSN